MSCLPGVSVVLYFPEHTWRVHSFWHCRLSSLHGICTSPISFTPPIFTIQMVLLAVELKYLSECKSKKLAVFRPSIVVFCSVSIWKLPKYFSKHCAGNHVLFTQLTLSLQAKRKSVDLLSVKANSILDFHKCVTQNHKLSTCSLRVVDKQCLSTVVSVILL